MENDELNRKIIEKVRGKIVISNLESEENMKLNKRKQILSLAAVATIILTGSFVTVNAATNGELVEKAKDTVKVIFVKDGKQEELKGTVYTDSNNHIIEKFELNNNGMEHILEADKTNLDGENMTVKETINQTTEGDELNIVLENR